MTKHKHNFDRRAPWAQSRLHGPRTPRNEIKFSELQWIALRGPKIALTPALAALPVDLASIFDTLSKEIPLDLDRRSRPSYEPLTNIPIDARIVVIDANYGHSRDALALLVRRAKDIGLIVEVIRRDEDVATIKVAVLESASPLARLLDARFIRVPDTGRRR